MRSLTETTPLRPLIRTTPATGAWTTVLLLALGACSSTRLIGQEPGRPPVYAGETFAANETFSRLFDAPVAEACESARRALLSQGYVISRADTRLVQGAKRFQPEGEVHVELSFHIVCAAESESTSTMFVSAQQDRYTLKKNPNAASVGISALGSISVPVGSTEDSLVKVASETVPAGAFYDRFFSLVQRMLRPPADAG